ncbi:MAG: alpha/beta hydrolase [Treponema sp.]|nr:alpha/beta hydrolase [Treponema sp.]
MQKKYLSSKNGKTVYWIHKKENARSLVMLHGLTADHRLFDKQVDALREKYTVLVWDCPCHGKARPYNDFSYSNITEELKRILDAEQIEKAVFVGQSFGGMIAAFFIEKNPQMALGFVSIGSVPFGDYYSKSDYFWLNQLKWMCRLFPFTLLKKSLAKACGATKGAQNKMMDMLSTYDKKELCQLIYVGETAFVPENHEITLSCPVVLILGSKDKVGKVRRYNDQWHKRTGYPLYLIDGAAHNANDDCPEEVNRIVQDFAESV